MSSPQLEWAAIQRIGSPPGPAVLGWNRLAVATNQDGRLEAFTVGGDGAIWHSWQEPAGGWSGWASLGAPPGVNFASFGGPPIQAVQNADGRLEIFVLGPEGIWHIWQVAPNVNWEAAWSALSRPPSDTLANYFLAASNELGELEVFMVSGAVDGIFSRSQTAPNGGWEADWTQLGIPPVLDGYLPQIFGFTVAPPNGNLFFQIIAWGSDNNLWRNRRSRFIEGSTWSGWTLLSLGPGKGLMPTLVVRENLDRRLELLATTTNLDIWHTWESGVDVWSGEWADLQQPPGLWYGSIDMRLDSEGRLTIVLYQDLDGSLQTLRQTAPNNGWSGWGPLSQPNFNNLYGTSEAVLLQGSKGLLYVFGVDANSEIFYFSQILSG